MPNLSFFFIENLKIQLNVIIYIMFKCMECYALWFSALIQILCKVFSTFSLIKQPIFWYSIKCVRNQKVNLNWLEIRYMHTTTTTHEIISNLTNLFWIPKSFSIFIFCSFFSCSFGRSFVKCFLAQFNLESSLGKSAVN